MSKQKSRHKKSQTAVAPAGATPPQEPGRRNFMLLGLGALTTLGVGAAAAYNAGWFDPSPPVRNATPAAAPFKALPPATLTANYENALRAAEEITSHYARELLTPWALIHAVRGFGRDFKMHDGTRAVDHLCTKYAEDREVNGQRYVYFQRYAEVHENSFLKTFLEAGVSPDQSLRVGERTYTLRILGEHAKALFRCDPADLARYEPKLLEEHLPWGLIAFSRLVSPEQAVWTNAYGEKIDLHQVIDRAFASYETMCTGVRDTIARGEDESLEFRQAINKHSCFGLHTVYGFFACYKQGYRRNQMPQRVQRLLDLTIHRMDGDAKAIDREADAAKAAGPEAIKNYIEGRAGSTGSPPTQVLEAMRLRSQIKLQGHALEAINFGLLNKLFSLTPEQRQRVQKGEQALYQNIIDLRALDLDAFRRWNGKFVSDLVITMGHAVRALKLLTPNNPDLPAPAAG